MAALAAKYGLPSWQTETAYYPGFTKTLSEWEIGWSRANEIHFEIIAGASAVEGMCLIWVDAEDPRYHQTVRYSGHHVVMKSDGTNVTGWEVTKDCGVVFAHYARFVKPGDHRVETRCEDKFLNATAYLSEKDGTCTVVAINNGKAARRLSCTVDGLPWKAEHVGAVCTDAGSTWHMRPVEKNAKQGASAEYAVELSPRSLTTIVWARNAIAGSLARDFLKTPGAREEYTKNPPTK